MRTWSDKRFNENTVHVHATKDNISICRYINYL